MIAKEITVIKIQRRLNQNQQLNIIDNSAFKCLCSNIDYISFVKGSATSHRKKQGHGQNRHIHKITDQLLLI